MDPTLLLLVEQAYTGFANIHLICLFALLRNWALIKTYIDPFPLTATLTCGAIIFVIFQTIRYVIGLSKSSTSAEVFQSRPLIFPCRTSHTRLFLKTHSFSYSYLWVGVPVGWKGSVGGMVSSDVAKETSPWYVRLLSLRSGGAWFTVNGDDYLGRGHVDGGLEEKLQIYLRSLVSYHLKYS
jgi:hypothetical protein